MKGVNKFKDRLKRNMKPDSPKAEASNHSFGQVRVEPSNAYMDEMVGSDDDPELMEGGKGSGGRRQDRLTHLTADNNNNLWVAWQHGRNDRYHFNGKLISKKVRMPGDFE